MSKHSQDFWENGSVGMSSLQIFPGFLQRVPGILLTMMGEFQKPGGWEYSDGSAAPRSVGLGGFLCGLIHVPSPAERFYGVSLGFLQLVQDKLEVFP